MQKVNYQRMLDETLVKIAESGRVPKLLLHSCCAPCSSYVLEYLSQFFSITVFYYNPNIYPPEEFYKRALEQKRFIERFPAKHLISFYEGTYEDARFYEMSRGLEDAPEGGERCKKCFRLRLTESAILAKEMEADFFTTTLSISPLKDAQVLNAIGKEISEQYDVAYLFSDFKKKNGYKRSCELSAEYGMYRQDYCGCVYSYRARCEENACRDSNGV